MTHVHSELLMPSYVGRTLLLVPRNLGIALLVAYRTVISPLYGDVCRYHPTCSAYSLRAVQDFGLLRGCWLTAKRLVRCVPWARGGIDDVPEAPYSRTRRTRLGFVVAEP
ncbi:MAG: membrane protein insertion efficiency factor YidD [Pseudoclavibacter sp.]